MSIDVVAVVEERENGPQERENRLFLSGLSRVGQFYNYFDILGLLVLNLHN
jgi:hypothetical protein